MVLQTMISIEPDPGANMKLRPHLLGALPQIGANQRHEHRTKGKGPCPRLLGQIAQIEVSARFVIFCTVETVLNLGLLTRLGYWGPRHFPCKRASLKGEHARAQKLYTCATIHRSLEGFQSVDLPLGLTIAPWLCDCIFNGVNVSMKNPCKSFY